MNKLPVTKINPILAAVLVLITALMLYQFVGGLLVFFTVGTDINYFNAPIVRIYTTLTQFFFLLVLTIISAKLFYNDFYITFKISKPKIFEIILSVLGLIFLVLAMQFFIFLQSNFLDFISSRNSTIAGIVKVLNDLDKIMQQSYATLLESRNIGDFVSIAIAVAITPAFCEEFLFRGFVLTSFEQKLKPFWAVLITGLLFGLFHFNFMALFPLFAIGAYFSYIAYKTQNIFIPIILHFLNNFVTVSAYHFTKQDWIIEAAPKSDLNNSFLLIGFFANMFLFFTVLNFLNKLKIIKS